jgi:hypothetical protein
VTAFITKKNENHKVQDEESMVDEKASQYDSWYIAIA